MQARLCRQLVGRFKPPTEDISLDTASGSFDASSLVVSFAILYHFASWSFRRKCGSKCSNSGICKKDGQALRKKRYFLLDFDFLVNSIDTPTSNYTWRNVCFLSIEWFQGWWVLLGEWPTLTPLHQSLFWGLWSASGGMKLEKKIISIW
jgi:hypothetical protein